MKMEIKMKINMDIETQMKMKINMRIKIYTADLLPPGCTPLRTPLRYCWQAGRWLAAGLLA